MRAPPFPIALAAAAATFRSAFFPQQHKPQPVPVVKVLKALLFLITRLVQLAVLAEVALLLVNLDVYKPKLEEAASDALGMDVSIQGPVRLSVLAGPRFALKDIRVQNRDTELATVAYAGLGLDLSPLRDRQAPAPRIELDGVQVFVERRRDGFNFASRRASGGALPAFELARLSITDGTLRYVDRRSGGRVEATGCNLDSDNVLTAGGKDAPLWKAFSFEASVACREIRIRSLTLSRVRATVSGADGVFHLRPLEMRMLGGHGRGRVRVDFSGPVPRARVRYALSQFQVEQLFRNLPAGKRPRGRLDLSAALSLAGATADRMIRSANGQVSLRGGDLVLEGVDVDDVIVQFESSQGVKLLDIGALIYGGPLGLLVSRGVNLASAVPESGGRTRIAKLVSDWTIRAGVAHAKDVALATPRHRIALQGKLDLAHKRFDDVVVAVVGADGCARLPHALTGQFRDPALDRPGALASFAGPLLRFFKAVGECEVFYAGAVPAPE